MSKTLFLHFRGHVLINKEFLSGEVMDYILLNQSDLAILFKLTVNKNFIFQFQLDKTDLLDGDFIFNSQSDISLSLYLNLTSILNLNEYTEAQKSLLTAPEYNENQNLYLTGLSYPINKIYHHFKFSEPIELDDSLYKIIQK